jgi:hypothetical protein
VQAKAWILKTALTHVVDRVDLSLTEMQEVIARHHDRAMQPMRRSPRLLWACA